VFISASKYNKSHDKSIENLKKMKFWIREFPQNLW